MSTVIQVRGSSSAPQFHSVQKPPPSANPWKCLRIPPFSKGTASKVNALVPRVFSFTEATLSETGYLAARNILLAVGAAGVAATIVTLVVSLPPAVPVAIGLASGANWLGAGAAHEASKLKSWNDTAKKVEKNAQEASQQNTLLAAQNTFLAARNASLAENVQELTTQNAGLRKNIEDLTRQIAELALQNESFRGISAQFQAQLEQLRTGNVADRGALLAVLGQFTEQFAASQELWRRISLEASTSREGLSAHIAQIRELIAPLTDPKNTLLRMDEHRLILSQIQEAVANLTRHQIRLSELDVQIAQRQGQLQARDELLAELKTAHEGILARYGKHDETLGRQIERLTKLCAQI